MVVVDRSTAIDNENAVEFPKHRGKDVRSLQPSREERTEWGRPSVTVGSLVVCTPMPGLGDGIRKICCQ